MCIPPLKNLVDWQFHMYHGVYPNYWPEYNTCTIDSYMYVKYLQIIEKETSKWILFGNSHWEKNFFMTANIGNRTHTKSFIFNVKYYELAFLYSEETESYIHVLDSNKGMGSRSNSKSKIVDCWNIILRVQMYLANIQCNSSNAQALYKESLHVFFLLYSAETHHI